MSETIAQWKERMKRQAAKEFGVKPGSILLVPRNSKRGIKATWQTLGPVLCPANNKEYRAYWCRTEAEFKAGKRVDARVRSHS